MPGKKSKQRRREEFDSFVEHPRYGRHPHFTGLNPATDYDSRVVLHWHSREEVRIADTAIAADLSRQSPATIPVTHYFDVRRTCRDCGRPFIFFAQEQMHWYEELGFSLESDCVRCVPCRKNQQGLARKEERYREFFHQPDRTTDENLEMADCCLALIEAAIFTLKQVQRVRRLLKEAEPHLTDQNRPLYEELQARLKTLDAKM